MKLNRIILVLMISGLVLATTGCNNEEMAQGIEESTEQKEQSEDLVADENSSVGVEEDRDTTEQSTQSVGRNENQATENRNTGNNSRPSNTTNNTNTNNTSAPSRNPATEAPAPSTTTTTPSTAAPSTTTAHTHSWQTVHHEEVGHYESVLVQEEIRKPIYTMHTVCTNCGHDYTANGEIPGPGVHTCADGMKGAGYGSEMTYDHDQVFPAVYEDRWVVDTPAYDEQVCSACGQKK